MSWLEKQVRSKYALPHQGEKETERRRQQIDRGQLRKENGYVRGR